MTPIEIRIDCVKEEIPSSLKVENMQEKAAMHAVKFSYVWVSTLRRCSEDKYSRCSAAICWSHPVAQTGLPDWIWIGQEALSNQFHRVVFEPFLRHSWGKAIRSLCSCFSQEYHNAHLYRFLCHCVIPHPSTGTCRSLSSTFLLLLFSGKEQYPPPFTGFHIPYYTASPHSMDRQTSALSSSMFFI